ncbi:MAG: leucine-rich repeat domain-containing protein [Oscillospiraceae bacterium]|nr:leucine-rich repeat domain-containing protein [Oscillospiraceae bacterium]
MDFWSYMLGKEQGGSGSDSGSGEEKWIGDGNTHIWIELSEERKSPMLGLAVNGSAVVDWGDGTSPDVLTGTSSTPSDVLWTPRHEYSRGGEYVITLTVDGQAGVGGVSNSNAGSYLLRNSAESDGCNIVYRNAIKRVELGTGIVNVGAAGLGHCYSLRGLKFPESKLTFGSSCVISCRRLEKFNMSNNDSPLGGSMFSGCEGLREVVLSESITDIPSSTFSGCTVLTYIKIPGKVSNVMASAFNNCYSMKVCDFTDHSAVPTLSSTSVFNNVPEDCEIRVPAALAEEWKAASNWSTYADRIVGV